MSNRYRDKTTVDHVLEMFSNPVYWIGLCNGNLLGWLLGVLIIA